MTDIFDLVIVGAGIHGSCAAYFARKAGLNVLLLDQFALPHSRGSSIGQSRITRRAYPQSYYANMMNQAYELWDSLEQAFGKRLFIKTGLLYAVQSGSKKEAHLQNSFESNKCEFKKYNAAEVQAIYPQISLADDATDFSFFWDPHAGVLLANQCLAAVQTGFLSAGGTLRDGETVCKVNQESDGTVCVRTLSGGEYRAKKAILVPGAWAKRLFAETGLTVPVEPHKVFSLYWRVREAGSTSFRSPNWPAIIWENETADNAALEFYGTPEFEYTGYVKMCAHFGIPIEQPEERDRSTPSISRSERELIDHVRNLIGRHLPGLDNSAPSIIETCMYSMTPDRDFIIDHHPLMNNVVVASCCSGHAFKMSPLIGRLLVQLATGEQPSCDLSPFRLARFAERT